MATEQPSTESDWGDVSFIISSDYRIAVFQRLMDGPATPSTIAEDTDISIAHVSRELGRMREEELVKLLVPEERRKGRVYGLQDTARDLVDRVEEVA